MQFAFITRGKDKDPNEQRIKLHTKQRHLWVLQSTKPPASQIFYHLSLFRRTNYSESTRASFALHFPFQDLIQWQYLVPTREVAY